MSKGTFEDLVVWQKAHQFVLEVYKFSNLIPKDEMFTLTSQFRRAAVSISANIAEGYKKSGKKDKQRFFNISQGSVEECRYYLILAKDLGYGHSEKMVELLNEVSKILTVYSNKIKETIRIAEEGRQK